MASTYVLNLIAGRYTRAWNLLAARSQQQAGSLAAFTAERAAFFRSAGKRFIVSAADNSASALQQWLPSDFTGVAGRAFVVRVDYPKLAGNNAGWEMFVVAPNANGAWRIWVVR